MHALVTSEPASFAKKAGNFPARPRSFTGALKGLGEIRWRPFDLLGYKSCNEFFNINCLFLIKQSLIYNI